MQKIKYGKEARAAIKAGVDKSADAIKVTLGPVGGTMVIDQGGMPIITDDGVSGAKVIRLEDPFEDVGAKLIREVATKANDQAGDGTTTATVLAQAMLSEAFKVIDEHPEKVQEVIKGLKLAQEDAFKQLDAMARPVSGKEDIRRVALISSLDGEAADAIADAIETLGEKATIVVEEGSKPGLSLETVKGMRLPKGLYNGYFVTNFDRMTAEAIEPKVIVTDKRIASAEQMGKLLKRLQESQVVNFVLIADDMSPDAAATLFANHQKGYFVAMPIQAPYEGARRRQALEDIAALTGGQVISEGLGHRFDSFPLECIGSCEKVTASQKVATFIGGKGDVSERVSALEKEMEDTKVAYDREVLSQRVSGLTGGIGVLRVGAVSDSEIRARRYKIEDALNATKAAIEEGIVPGGGAALAWVGGMSDNEIFNAALPAPAYQMEDNSGLIGSTEADSLDMCTNFSTGERVNAFEAGIVDPVKVTKSSLAAAVSVVSTVLSVGSLIVEIPEKE